MRMRLVIGLLACVVASTGCLTSKSLQSARTLERGRTRVSGAGSVGVTGLLSTADQPFGVLAFPVPPGTRGVSLVPGGDVEVRHGLTDSIEVGGRLGTSGL